MYNDFTDASIGDSGRDVLLVGTVIGIPCGGTGRSRDMNQIIVAITFGSETKVREIGGDTISDTD